MTISSTNEPPAVLSPTAYRRGTQERIEYTAMPPHKKEDDDGDGAEKNIVLSGASPIQVKFIGWLVIVCAGGFGGWIWWAATMSAKLDTVISNQAVATAATRAVEADVARLKEWRVQVDTIGSPTMVKRVDDLVHDVESLRREFELHKAITPAPKP